MKSKIIKNKIRRILSVSPIDFWRVLKKIVVKNKNNDSKNDKIIHNYFLNYESHKLQIGSGNNIIKGWLNTDLTYNEELSVAKLDAGKKFNFKNETFSFIFSEHLFEHLTFAQATNMIRESYRVLKPNGYIRIATPDLNFLIKLYKDKDLLIHKEYIEWAAKSFCKEINSITDNNSILAVYVINNFFRDWGHQIIHNFETIKNLLELEGFTDVTEESIGGSSVEELKNLEKHGEKILNRFNNLETIVIQAKKPK